MTYTPNAITDISGLATKEELLQGLFRKANASTVGGLATAINAKADQGDLDALAAKVAEIVPAPPEVPEP